MRILLILLVAFSSLPLLAKRAPRGAKPVKSILPAGSQWKYVAAASDEFFGNELNPKKWKKGLWYDVSGVLAFKSENIVVANGYLSLSAKQETFNGKAFTYGAVESKFDVHADSYLEIRAKALDKSANVLSAIWMQSSPLSVENNPNPEIDIQETFHYDHLCTALHTWQVEPDKHIAYGGHNHPVGVDVSQDFHLYGLERRDGKLRFYFDGKFCFEKVPQDSSIATMARHVVLSLEGHLGQPNGAELPKAFLIDHVRSYRYLGPAK